MDVFHHARDLAAFHHGVFVPTMGALHEGHASLIRLAAHHASRTGPDSVERMSGGGVRRETTLRQPAVVVSIFVNPTQFGPNEDYSRYPRTLGADIDVCRAAGADAVYAPAVDDVYPADTGASAGAGHGRVRLPDVATLPHLEDAQRPEHFAGVCQVVRRLFNLVRPCAAVFGEKDFQQLRVIEAMTASESLGIEIVPGPTVRERDGLALSSRNRFLSSSDRSRATTIHQALRFASSQPTPAAAQSYLRDCLHRAGIHADYAVVRDSRSLLELPLGEMDTPVRRLPPLRALVAARVGSVRLLDNMGLAPVPP